MVGWLRTKIKGSAPHSLPFTGYSLRRCYVSFLLFLTHPLKLFVLEEIVLSFLSLLLNVVVFVFIICSFISLRDYLLVSHPQLRWKYRVCQTSSTKVEYFDPKDNFIQIRVWSNKTGIILIFYSYSQYTGIILIFWFVV